MSEQEPTLIERITGWLPLAYGVITFIGFLNYHTYYHNFGINIASYLTAGELLLAFLPVAVPIAWMIVFYLAMRGLAALLFAISSSGSGTPSNNRPAILSLSSALRDVREDLRAWKWRSWKSYLKPLVWVLTVGGGLFVWYLFLSVPFHLFYALLTGQEFWEWRINDSPVLIALWAVFYWDAIDHGVKNERIGVNYAESVRYGVLGLLLILHLAGKNELKSTRLKEGSLTVRAKVITESDTLINTQCWIYVGRVDAGVFWHDEMNRTNLLIPSSEIRSVEVQEE